MIVGPDKADPFAAMRVYSSRNKARTVMRISFCPKENARIGGQTKQKRPSCISPLGSHLQPLTNISQGWWGCGSPPRHSSYQNAGFPPSRAAPNRRCRGHENLSPIGGTLDKLMNEPFQGPSGESITQLARSFGVSWYCLGVFIQIFGVRFLMSPHKRRIFLFFDGLKFLSCKSFWLWTKTYSHGSDKTFFS